MKLSMQAAYIGNFLSAHGINPTYSEFLTKALENVGFRFRCASGYKQPIFRLAHMVATVLSTAWRRGYVVIDLYSGKRAFWWAAICSQLANCLGVPIVMVLHGGNLPQYAKRYPKRVRRALLSAHTVICPSEYLASIFSHMRPVKVIPNAIAVEKYHCRVRNQLKPNILFLRSFHRLTDPQTAIRSFALIAASYPEARMTMVGFDEDGTLEICIKLVRVLGLENQITFRGRIPKSEIYGLGDTHDIFFHTNLVDNTPVSVIEAMAMGLCIIATKVGGIPFLLKDGQNALLYEPGDYKGMAEKTLMVLSDLEIAPKLCERARRQAEDFSWTKIMPQWAQLLTDICRSNNVPD